MRVRSRKGAGELIEGSQWQAGRRATACKKGVHGEEVEAEPGADSGWQGRLLQGEVVVASPGLLPQAGHQVSKLEHANVSSKLQHRLPQSNLLAAVLHLILNAFIVQRLEYFIT
jgi:hypothetical protein